jgi:hypothetical protein
MRTINSTGSADQGMMSERQQAPREVIVWPYLIFAVIGVRATLAATAPLRAGDARSLARSPAHTHAPYYDIKWNGQDTHKGPASYSTITHSLVLPFSFSSIKKILYNAIIPARTVLFWCATVFLLLTPGSSSWSHRDAGTTQMTHHRHKTSMTH